MKRVLIPFALVTLLFAGAWAQNRGAGRIGPGQRNQAALPKTLSTIDGVVTAVNLGIGQGSPSIVVEGSQVLLGPYFYLESVGFTVEVGDHVQATVFPSLVYDGLLVAIRVDNLSQGVSAELRSESGLPLWNSTGHPSRTASCACGGAPNVDAAETFIGVVSVFDAATGERFPTITLSDGTMFAAGPYRAWVQTDFSIEPGDQISALAFPCATDDSRWVAMKVDNLTRGTQIILRDDAGMPTSAGARSPIGRRAGTR